MISREEIHLAFQLFLGRAPENEAVINHLLAEAKNINDLREKLIIAPEFIQKLKIVPYPKISMQAPPMQVDLHTSGEQLQTIFQRIIAQWSALGNSEPYWSVLTNPGYLNENIEENKNSFYQSGKGELVNFFAALKRAKINPQSLSKCLELGCGVGRVTAALAAHYPSVIGVDVSPEHLRLADAYLHDQGLTNIELALLSDLQSLPELGKFDLFYSQIVLQHNPPPITKHLLEQLLNQLNPRGIAYFQIPTYKIGYTFNSSSYLSNQGKPQMEMHYFPQDALFQIIQDANCKVLEMREDTAIGPSLSAISNTILLMKN